jgi:hypothetical protein
MTQSVGHVAEERDLLLHALRQRPVGAAQEHVGLDADLPQLLHGVLGGLGLELARGADPRHEGDVHGDGVGPHLQLELPDGLEEGQRLDVADGAADLDDGHVDAVGGLAHARLDLVGDVRDHLHRGAEVLAAALLGDDRLVDAPGGEVVGAGRRAVVKRS